MPEQIDREKIFRTLADTLPENLLLDLFPDHSPHEIRTLIRDAGGIKAPQQGKSLAAPDRSGDPGTGLPGGRMGSEACSLYTDGASRGNPGDAGAGIVLLGTDGKELQARSFYLGKCTNNAAEYQALIAGLECALETGCRSLNIFMDSQLIVRQVQGIYRVKNEQLRPMYNRTRDLLARLRSWEINHIPREKNCRADELANRGIDDNTGAH